MRDSSEPLLGMRRSIATAVVARELLACYTLGVQLAAAVAPTLAMAMLLLAVDTAMLTLVVEDMLVPGCMTVVDGADVTADRDVPMSRSDPVGVIAVTVALIHSFASGSFGWVLKHSDNRVGHKQLLA